MTYPPQGQDPYGQQPGYGQDPYGQQQPGYGQQPGYAQQPPGPAGFPQGPGQAQFDQYGRPLSDKSKMVAGLLSIFLGQFGAGRWYTGHTGLAVGQLLTCGGCGVWALIDGIMLLAGDHTDAEGKVLRSN